MQYRVNIRVLDGPILLDQVVDEATAIRHLDENTGLRRDGANILARLVPAGTGPIEREVIYRTKNIFGVTVLLEIALAMSPAPTVERPLAC